MSLYATIIIGEDPSDERDGGDVATNSGWYDFGEWIATLDGIDELRNLAHHGWSDDGLQLLADIDGAIEGGNPTPDQRSIASGLRRIAAGMQPGSVVTISDGTGVEEDG